MREAINIVLTTFVILTILFVWYLLVLQGGINQAIILYMLFLIIMVGLPLLAVGGWHRDKFIIMVSFIYNILFLLTLLGAIF